MTVASAFAMASGEELAILGYGLAVVGGDGLNDVGVGERRYSRRREAVALNLLVRLLWVSRGKCGGRRRVW